jgi:hydrogenase maturation protease
VNYLIGLGNWTMGDDSVGLRIVEEVVRRGLENDFEAVLLPDSGLNLIDYFRDDVGKIVVVDTVRAGREPGEPIFFRPEEVETGKTLGNVSTHEGDILRVIELARQLQYPIPSITILGIEPENMSPGGLSKKLHERIGEYVSVAVSQFEKQPASDRQRF